MSRFIPNSTQVPNEFFDSLMGLLTPVENTVLFYLARRTFGFGKREDRISLSQICDGIVRADGTILDRGTGLSRPAASKALRVLVEFGIAQQGNTNQYGTLYRMDVEGMERSVKMDKLIERDAERKASRQNVAAGRNTDDEGGKRHLPQVVNGVYPQDGPGSKRRLPQVVNAVYPRGSTAFTHNIQDQYISSNILVNKGGGVYTRGETSTAQTPPPPSRDSGAVAGGMEHEPAKAPEAKPPAAQDNAARRRQIMADLQDATGLTPNWAKRDAAEFMTWAMALPEGQTFTAFIDWWFANDWRGKKGELPTLNQIREQWLQAFAQKTARPEATIARSRYQVELDELRQRYDDDDELEADEQDDEAGYDPSLDEVVNTSRGGETITAGQAWDTVSAHLAMEMPKSAYDTWLRAAELLRYEHPGSFVVGVPSEQARAWLADRLANTTTRLLTGVCNFPATVEFVCVEAEYSQAGGV